MAFKAYTRTGDKGDTSLMGGKRVNKSSARVEAYGEVDELNSFVGLALARANADGFSDVGEALRRVQRDLFVMGADLATPEGAKAPKETRVTQEMVRELEGVVDGFTEKLEQPHHFILPTGVPTAALLHVCRSVARRVERKVVALSMQEKVSPEIVTYLNRLSSLFFVAAKEVNRRAKFKEEEWQG